jgi:hypothetical protein
MPELLSAALPVFWSDSRWPNSRAPTSAEPSSKAPASLSHSGPDATLRVYAHLFRRDDGKGSSSDQRCLGRSGEPMIATPSPWVAIGCVQPPLNFFCVSIVGPAQSPGSTGRSASRGREPHDWEKEGRARRLPNLASSRIAAESGRGKTQPLLVGPPLGHICTGCNREKEEFFYLTD